MYVKPNSNVRTVRMWSDGPSSQFKNHYMFHFLKLLCKRYNLNLTQWNFFASSHGKGAVDGVGGSAKRIVWQRIKSRQATVKDANDFVTVLSASGSDISARLITDFESYSGIYDDILTSERVRLFLSPFFLKSLII
jgi:hypothetical protein